MTKNKKYLKLPTKNLPKVVRNYSSFNALLFSSEHSEIDTLTV